MRRASRIDKPLTILLVILVVGGAFVFSSAAFGLLGRGETHITSVVFNHFALGLGLGLLALLLGLTVDYRIWRRYALALYIAALALTALVFIPTLGLEHGGGTRWLDIFGFSFQPSEVLKVAAIIMAAAYFAGMKTKTATFSYGLGDTRCHFHIRSCCLYSRRCALARRCYRHCARHACTRCYCNHAAIRHGSLTNIHKPSARSARSGIPNTSVSYCNRLWRI